MRGVTKQQRGVGSALLGSFQPPVRVTMSRQSDCQAPVFRACESSDTCPEATDSTGSQCGLGRHSGGVGRQPIREPAEPACSRAVACCLIRQAIVPFVARPGEQRAFWLQSVIRTGSSSARERPRNSVDYYNTADCAYHGDDGRQMWAIDVSRILTG